jgi:hypothetical protein
MPLKINIAPPTKKERNRAKQNKWFSRDERDHNESQNAFARETFSRNWSF